MKLAFVLLLLAVPFAHAENTVSFCAGGDILLDRGIRKSINKNGIDFPFKGIAPLIKSHDLAMANFECPTSTSGYYLGKKYSFDSPPDYLPGMRNSGFNIAVVANNHTIDRGRDAFLQTINFLKTAGIEPVGGGTSQSEAIKPVLIEKNGIKFAFLASVDMLLEGLPFIEDLPAPAWATTEQLSDEIKRIRPKVDFIVVSQHWGVQFQDSPTINQKKRAHALIDAGADVLIGHHPHVLQGIEFYKGKPILYSLGNLVFDQYLAPAQQSALASFKFEKGNAPIPLITPILIKDGIPVPADKDNSELIIGHLKTLSKSFGTNFVTTFYGAAALPSLPISIGELGNTLAVVLPGEIIHLGKSPTAMSQLPVSHKKTITQAITKNGENSLVIYAIEDASSDNTKSNLAAIEVSTDGITRAFSDAQQLNPWKLMIADVDGDGRSELCAGVKKATRFDHLIKNRLFVFNMQGAVFWPKWLGSELHLDIVDFDFAAPDTSGRQKLLLLANCDPIHLCIASYQWDEFGFKGPHIIATNITIDQRHNWQKLAQETAR